MGKKITFDAEILTQLKEECEGKGKVHLLRLKSLAKQYNAVYPGEIDMDKLNELSPNNARKLLSSHLCANIEKMAHPKSPAAVPVAPKPKPTVPVAPKLKPASPKLPSPKPIAPQPKPVAGPPKVTPKPPYNPKAPPKVPSPKPAEKKKLPIVKPVPLEELPTIELTLTTKAANASYLTDLKKKVSEIENKGYNVEAFEKDITSDDFVRKALAAHIQALEYKLKTYQKLSEVNWQGHVGGMRQAGKDGHTIDLNALIKKLEEDIKTKLKELKSSPTAFEDKREELLSILYDPDNGIATIRGKSRENVRISLLKIIYMFLKVPVFFFKGFINFMVTGPAGSGKTKIAGVIAHMMKNLGILATKKVTMATKQNLVGEFVGHSGPKTRSLLAGSLEGVVFIDEAYTLTPCPGSLPSNFSEEAVGELINFVDKFIGCLVVIVAGYKKKMYDCFLAFNEGMSRRFPKVVDLIPYNSDDLYEIFESFLADSVDVPKTLTKDQRIYIKSIIAKLNEAHIFNNQAGDMLNLSKVIGEDAVLFAEEYDRDMIKLSFKKFCANKNIAIDF